ncbi:hypothetical protein FOA43_001061 [Brettanomyces nanus]|uniref:Dol-P-Man:Man(5)GlcNAc(2)-PP-Dol alpha-1,3-mannosyltransferase n=1 Tax=Eeniella nana TaxID=13502 RepID=A0A875RYG2_EENNA|nr:uncharacterized protein FOA43_001061 [Brettanomyces nanus]QPG73748.1 hypothetical protein FOA43_001061 [Brettanomyces nanus]
MAPSGKEETSSSPPPFSWSELAKDAVWSMKSLVINPEFCRIVVFPLLIAESIAMEVIILNVPYTEIDYSTYMQQIDLIEKGELHYSQVAGDTGPIVYPGGYVWIYSWMKFLTNGIENLRLGQEAFRILYLATLLLVFVAYFLTGAHIRPYLLYLLVLSKRLHSIYVLRLFNDCFATFFSVAAVVALQVAARVKVSGGFTSKNSRWLIVLCLLAADLLAVAISVKMNALLYLPGFLVVVYFLCNENLLKTALVSLFGFLVELGMNSKFLFDSDLQVRTEFISNAFDFGRQFLFEWSVNWKFLGPQLFSSRVFHTALLILHVIVLLAFLFCRWLSKSLIGKSLSQFIRDAITKPHQDTICQDNVIFSPDNSTNFVLWVMTLSNFIGVLFSRSLHYQFLCWYSYSLPYLLYTTGLPMVVITALFAAHEWCWDVYPSTPVSSAVLVSILLIVVVANYLSNPFRIVRQDTKSKEE